MEVPRGVARMLILSGRVHQGLSGSIHVTVVVSPILGFSCHIGHPDVLNVKRHLLISPTVDR